MSLLWWVVLANGAMLVVALLLLTFSPIEIDAPIQLEQFAVLLAGFSCRSAWTCSCCGGFCHRCSSSRR